MRKKITALTVGVAAAMLIAAGCAGQSDSHTSAVESTAQTGTAAESETSTETGTSKAQETDTKAEEESKEETPDSGSEETEDNLAEDGLEVPVKIWGEITEIAEGVIYVDNQSENSSTGEIVLNIDPENTLILDGENGFPVEFGDIQKGKFEAYLGPAMTMSLPPQTTPVMVIVNLPEETSAAQYVIAAGTVEEKDGVKTLGGKGGGEYTLSQEVSIIPFLTRQMVTLEDIQEDSRCLVWLGADETVERIVLFN